MVGQCSPGEERRDSSCDLANPHNGRRLNHSRTTPYQLCSTLCILICSFVTIYTWTSMFQLENSRERSLHESSGDALVSSNWNGLGGACDDRAATWDKRLSAPACKADSFQATRLVESRNETQKHRRATTVALNHYKIKSTQTTQ